MLRSRLWWPSLALVVMVTTPLFADEQHPLPYPTLPWVALQLVPSPGLAIDHGEAAFAAQWSVTPMLYSFGIHRSLSPWRFGVVEPAIRHSGSLELRGGLDYLSFSDDWSDRFGGRISLKSHWPLVEHGESLSWSLGSSVCRFGARTIVEYQLGVHTLLGILGLVAGMAPTPEGPRWLFVTEVRVL